eukprot:1235469-Pleurochrysis_carterae.AAC.1
MVQSQALPVRQAVAREHASQHKRGINGRTKLQQRPSRFEPDGDRAASVHAADALLVLSAASHEDSAKALDPLQSLLSGQCQDNSVQAGHLALVHPVLHSLERLQRLHARLRSARRKHETSGMIAQAMLATVMCGWAVDGYNRSLARTHAPANS